MELGNCTPLFIANCSDVTVFLHCARSAQLHANFVSSRWLCFWMVWHLLNVNRAYLCDYRPKVWTSLQAWTCPKYLWIKNVWLKMTSFVEKRFFHCQFFIFVLTPDKTSNQRQKNMRMAAQLADRLAQLFEVYRSCLRTSPSDSDWTCAKIKLAVVHFEFQVFETLRLEVNCRLFAGHRRELFVVVVEANYCQIGHIWLRFWR